MRGSGVSAFGDFWRIQATLLSDCSLERFVITAANVSSGIDLAPYLVRRFFGPERPSGWTSNLNPVRRDHEILEYGVATI